MLRRMGTQHFDADGSPPSRPGCVTPRQNGPRSPSVLAQDLIFRIAGMSPSPPSAIHSPMLPFVQTSWQLDSSQSQEPDEPGAGVIGNRSRSRSRSRPRQLILHSIRYVHACAHTCVHNNITEEPMARRQPWRFLLTVDGSVSENAARFH
jgi:hypothetical protein